MKKNIVCITLCLLFQATVISAFAQSKPKAGDIISGVVSDNEGPLMSVIVMEKNDKGRVMSQSVTDNNGAFSFKLVNPDNRITVSYKGYLTVDMPISKTYFDIKLKYDPESGKITDGPDQNAQNALPRQNPSNMGHEYVNLGLSVMWATCNIGASTPQEYGDYYAWGETVPHYEPGYAQEEPQAHWKSDMSGGYWWNTYKWSKGTNSTLTKYCNDSDSGNEGLTDKMTKLVPGDDAANVLWGGTWRMPTKSEMEELFNKCTWTWTKENGIYGYRVTSKVSGYTDRSIFLPAAGIRGGKSLNGLNSDGMYWSSSLDTDNTLMAWCIYFVDADLENIDDDVSVAPFSRHNGQSIRPVCP